MAKVKIKLGENEVEIDSRDFYVDNQSIGEVIESISKHIPENSAKIVYQTQPEPQNQSVYENQETTETPTYDSLDSLENAEVFEPEFDAPKFLASYEIKPKLKILQTSGFFDTSRTVTETVQKLREYGWAASSLDVSKILTNMAMNCEMQKSAQENRNYYSTRNQIITN
ncbi:MAG: hypothetical protein R3327_06660 [Nitrosopumilaceae archaeon]|nr:hypothetical protein [Nitrosopumilaceae archaeon]